MNRCSLLTIREMQVKTTMRYDLQAVRMAFIKEQTNKTQEISLARMWRKGTLIHCWWECKLVQPLRKPSLWENSAGLCLSFWGTSTLFLIVVAPIYTLTNSLRGFPFFTSSPNLFLAFLIKAILPAVRSHLIVVLIWISLLVNDVEHLFMCLLSGRAFQVVRW